jgi:hypothetical protein
VLLTVLLLLLFAPNRSALQEFYQRLHVPPSSIQYSTTTYCLDR